MLPIEEETDETDSILPRVTRLLHNEQQTLHTSFTIFHRIINSTIKVGKNDDIGVDERSLENGGNADVDDDDDDSSGSGKYTYALHTQR